MNRISASDPVVDLFKKRMSIWKAKTLSFGGLVTVIKSVMNALPTYYFSLYRAPDGVIEKLEKLRRMFFFWGGGEGSDDKSKVNWVAWQRVIEPTDYGGLGLGSLRYVNVALLAKWWWRFKGERDCLWRRIIWSIHHSSRSWQSIPAKLSIPGPWKQIKRVEDELVSFGIRLDMLLKHVIKSGNNALFWLDFWIGEELLYLKLPLLFSLERDKGCTVADRLIMVDDIICSTWNWLRVPMSNLEVEEFRKLLLVCRDVVLVEGKDRIGWDLKKH
ncbi:putative mitochondrial protein AtMg00310 [Bidens hawaiensis]|uniref:putative mitochondrial protein AtMg00310 n=1 Tax=Bidens hawaiensis TaxID=980011 RepID=UPI00404B85D7